MKIQLFIWGVSGLLALKLPLGLPSLPISSSPGSETIEKVYDAQPYRFIQIDNINGGVKVEGKETDKISIVAEKTASLNAPTTNEPAIQFETSGDTLFVFVGEATSFGKKGRPRHSDKHGNSEKGAMPPKIDFSITLPNRVGVMVSTVNNGNIEVEGIGGTSCFHHVNGDIVLTKIQGKIEAETINGDLDVAWETLGDGETILSTLNGDITLKLAENPGSTISFRSTHGELYTDFAAMLSLPAETVKKETKGQLTNYQLSTYTQLQIGKSSKKLIRIDTFNGDIFLRKR